MQNRFFVNSVLVSLFSALTIFCSSCSKSHPNDLQVRGIDEALENRFGYTLVNVIGSASDIATVSAEYGSPVGLPLHLKFDGRDFSFPEAPERAYMYINLFDESEEHVGIAVFVR